MTGGEGRLFVPDEEDDGHISASRKGGKTGKASVKVKDQVKAKAKAVTAKYKRRVKKSRHITYRISSDEDEKTGSDENEEEVFCPRRWSSRIGTYAPSDGQGEEESKESEDNGDEMDGEEELLDWLRKGKAARARILKAKAGQKAKGATSAVTPKPSLWESFDESDGGDEDGDDEDASQGDAKEGNDHSFT